MEEVKNSFREHAKRLHPDTATSNKTPRDREKDLQTFLRIQYAYAHILELKKREEERAAMRPEPLMREVNEDYSQLKARVAESLRQEELARQETERALAAKMEVEREERRKRETARRQTVSTAD